MRKALTILACALALLAACEKPDNGNPSKPTPTPPTPPPTPAAPIVVAAGTDLKPTITSDGGDTKISFTAKESWTASVIETKSDNWISLDKTSGGAGDITITVTVQSNDSYDDRSATVQIKSGSTTIDILFSQKQTDALIVAVSEIKVGAEGDTIEIEVETNVNVSYKIESDGEGWISFVSTKALTTKVFTFAVAANETSSLREGTITLSGGSFTHQVKVTQDASVPTLSVSQNEFEVGPDGGQIKVTVSSNVSINWEYIGAGVWFYGMDSEAPNTYIFEVGRNYEYTSRSSEITFYNDEYNLKAVVKITQKPSDIVRFYDQNFKDFCLNNFDADGNGEISFDEAKAAKEIDYQAKTIDLYGLEAFVNLETLKIGSGVTDIEIARNECRLWNADTISSLTKLRHLECTYLYFNNLDISGIPDLEYLNVEGSCLSYLDVSRNSKLTFLDCSPMIYETLQYLSICKGQTIPNVTENRSDDYIPPYTQIYVDGTATGGGNEGTMEGGEI